MRNYKPKSTQNREFKYLGIENIFCDIKLKEFLQMSQSLTTAYLIICVLYNFCEPGLTLHILKY